eukprot:146605-Rhodomonas_salina.1
MAREKRAGETTSPCFTPHLQGRAAVVPNGFSTAKEESRQLHGSPEHILVDGVEGVAPVDVEAV